MPSSKITKQDVQKILSLAKLDYQVPNDVLDKYVDQLDAILNYADELKEIDTSSVSSTDIMFTTTVDKLREDEPNPDTLKQKQVRQRIINGFPALQGDLLVLPVKVIEN